MNWKEHIISNAEICHGKACIMGTRIPVSVILDNLSDGMNEEDILRSYPGLKHDDILASIGYASALSKDELFELV